MFSLKDKINVLIFTLQQMGWTLLTPERQRPILYEMLERLHLMLVGTDEKITNERWQRSYQIGIICRYKLIDVDTGEEITGEPVRGYGSSTFFHSREVTIIEARLKATSSAELQFITNLLKSK